MIMLVSCATPPKRIIDPRYEKANKHFKWLTYNIYLNVLDNALKYNIDYRYIIALIDAESQGDTWAHGTSNDIGLMQVIPKYHYKNKDQRLAQEHAEMVAIAEEISATIKALLEKMK